MDIRNVTEFARFLSSNDLVKFDSAFSQIVMCVNNYSAGCKCYKRQDKINLYATCCKMYFDAARHAASRYRNELLSKTTDRQISFYTDKGQLIAIASR